MTPKLNEDAQRLAIYIGESDRWRGKPLYAAILETLKAEKIAGATVVRGVAGFGAHSHIHTAAILRLSEDLPLIVHAIDTPEKIEKAIELVSPMVREGLITVEDVRVVRYTHRYLNPLPADRLVEEVMTREVETLAPEMPIAEAWQKMLDTLIKAMPVVDANGMVVGMLTDEDLLERAGVQQRLSVAGRLDAGFLAEELVRLRQSELRVAEVMSKPAITAKIHEPLGLAAARMSKQGVKRLPVLDEHGRLAGVLSRVDILRLLAEKPAAKMTAPLGAAQSVRDVMTPLIPAVNQDDELPEIVEKLLESGSHRLIVLDAAGKAIGLISDSDVVARVQPAQRQGVLAALMGTSEAPLSSVTASELMSPGVLTARPETPIVEAVRMMMNPKRKWLVVVDANDHPLGLVDRHILLRALTSGG
jgi:CBS-domain-containing membrane protein/PII-like signaling protein